MTIAIVGDSVSGTIAWGLETVAAGTPVRTVSSAFPGCGIASGIVVDANGEPYDWSQSCFENVPGVLEQLVRDWNPDVVVWSSTWELSDRLDPATNTVLKLGTPSHDRALLAQMEEQHDRLTAAGARIALLTIPPRAASDETGRPGDGEDGRYAHYNKVLRTFAKRHPDTVTLIDTVPFVCPGGVPCPKDVHGVVLRPDGGHFTHDTAPVIGRWLFPRLVAAAPPA
jgi:hypothetical protein